MAAEGGIAIGGESGAAWACGMSGCGSAPAAAVYRMSMQWLCRALLRRAIAVGASKVANWTLALIVYVPPPREAPRRREMETEAAGAGFGPAFMARIMNGTG